MEKPINFYIAVSVFNNIVLGSTRYHKTRSSSRSPI